MKLSDYDYKLDSNMIAQRPMIPRDNSRLFYLKLDEHVHLRFHEIDDILREGDVLVRNISKVIPARVEGRKVTGGNVELLFYRHVDSYWECLVKGARVREGLKVIVGDQTLTVKGKLGGGRYLMDCRAPEELMTKHGKMPTPPYIKEELSDPDEYQTIYAVEDGSIAAPTAGLHFTETIMDRIRNKGVAVHDVILHVGPGTFIPVRTEKVEDHSMEDEFFHVGHETAEAVTRANEDGRRVILVGTTTVRAIESVSSNGKVRAGMGRTELFIYPGYVFQSGMDLMLTNFHLPRSTLLMLVSAFAGRERVLSAYKEAIKQKYRFYSFGDAMLIEGATC